MNFYVKDLLCVSFLHKMFSRTLPVCVYFEYIFLKIALSIFPCSDLSQVIW